VLTLSIPAGGPGTGSPVAITSTSPASWQTSRTMKNPSIEIFPSCSLFSLS
jgi:hypothetical protein